MMKRGNEKICFEILKQILDGRYAPNEYYIGGIMDSAICIVQCDGGWSVFQSERGTRSWEKQHKNVEDACLDFLERMGMSQNGEKLKKEFNAALDEHMHSIA